MSYLMGWAGPLEADKAWKDIGSRFSKFPVYGAPERKGKIQLWRYHTKIGAPINYTPQPDGDCVSAAMRDMVNVLQCVEIFNGDREEFKPIFSPYHYWSGRALVGKNRLKGGPGSLGSWQAEAVKQHGVITYETPGVPAYDKNTTSAWGDDKPVNGIHPKTFLEQAKQNLVGDTARLATLFEVGDSITNLHPCTIAAQFGYQMKPDSKGIHQANYSDPWGHQMGVWGIDWDRELIEIKNQWGDVHGQLLDLDDGTPLPKGVIRTTFKHFMNHLKAGAEVYGISRFAGFPVQKYNVEDMV